MAKISEKDRGQLLRMAGNIAGGIRCAYQSHEAITGWQHEMIAIESVDLALAILNEADKRIEEINSEN